VDHQPITSPPNNDIAHTNDSLIDGNNRDDIMIPDEGRHAAAGDFELDRHSSGEKIQYQRFNRNPRIRITR
jgi:hypothetical protein